MLSSSASGAPGPSMVAEHCLGGGAAQPAAPFQRSAACEACCVSAEAAHTKQNIHVLVCEVTRVELRRIWRRASSGLPFSCGVESAFLRDGSRQGRAGDDHPWRRALDSDAVEEQGGRRASAASLFGARIRAMCRRSRPAQAHIARARSGGCCPFRAGGRADDQWWRGVLGCMHVGSTKQMPLSRERLGRAWSRASPQAISKKPNLGGLTPEQMLAGDIPVDDGGDGTKLADDDLVCNCHSVPKRVIKTAIKNGAITFADIKRCTKAGTGCGAHWERLGVRGVRGGHRRGVEEGCGEDGPGARTRGASAAGSGPTELGVGASAQRALFDVAGPEFTVPSGSGPMTLPVGRIRSLGDTSEMCPVRADPAHMGCVLLARRLAQRRVGGAPCTGRLCWLAESPGDPSETRRVWDAFCWLADSPTDAPETRPVWDASAADASVRTRPSPSTRM